MKIVYLKVSDSSAKTDILLDGAITARVKSIFVLLACKEIPENMISNTFYTGLPLSFKIRKFKTSKRNLKRESNTKLTVFSCFKTF